MTAEIARSGPANLSDYKALIIDRIYNISSELQYGKPKFLIALARHESVFLKYPQIIDSNGKFSIGLFHFQQASFDRYCWKKYFIGNDIMDIDTQIKCVIKMDRENKNLIAKNWVLSYKKIMAGK